MPLLQVQREYVYSYSEDDSHINEPGLPNSDPQEGEIRCEEILENDQIQRFKRQINLDLFDSSDTDYESEEDEESDEFGIDDSNSIYHQSTATRTNLPTQFCNDLDKRRNPVYKIIRNFQSDDIIITRNPFHQARAIGKRNKRQVDPIFVSEHESNNCMEPSSISEPNPFIGLERSSVFDHKSSNGDDQDSYFADTDNESDVFINRQSEFERGSEIFADEYVAYENFLRNAGVNLQYG